MGESGTRVAGYWACPHCGRHLQVVTSSDVPASGPFLCVCGNAMQPDEGRRTDRAAGDRHDTGSGRFQTETAREVRETQVSPTAGIWACDNCGRRIQVTEAAEHEKLKPFTCVCGAEMEPGGEYAPRPEDTVVDD
jgi:ribosomal protein L37AE/L43A